jgi:hypothetical protein
VGSEADSSACLNRAEPNMGTSTAGPAGSSTSPFPIGVSPATGSVPPPPGARP